ncbi:hypothetical protein N658DRAFT_493387 [Parathielavia hyrcaniae]|uniref:Uncharacterized protein n=1 Tax=Parathielavia hyrcaniae TaxID=113614 RepID=A0AAN6T3Y7_9PEZI|nr:hypothetical protein N658DRAFT_493387 [Parathielavia hyrcaniae]
MFEMKAVVAGLCFLLPLFACRWSRDEFTGRPTERLFGNWKVARTRIRIKLGGHGTVTDITLGRQEQTSEEMETVPMSTPLRPAGPKDCPAHDDWFESLGQSLSSGFPSSLSIPAALNRKRPKQRLGQGGPNRQDVLLR